MRVGIVGLPNVGKSTVFNSLTRAGAEAQNYPFTTIDPNLGVAAVPDGRLDALSETMKSRRVVPATVDFVDIAGLVRGASAGEGLGNQFLGHIRECDAIAHVVRCFVDEDVVHVEGKVDPEGDAETINTELLLADLATVERRLDRVGRAAKGGDAKLKAEAVELEKLLHHLSDGNPARSYPKSEALAEALGTLITAKPTLYVANVDEESVAEGNEYSARVEKLASREGAGVVRLSARLEAEIVDLGEEEAREYLEMLGLETTGFQEFVRAAYRLLGLVTFFTAGEKESRAWTVREGSTARTAAGRIHSDMERGFIAAEVGDWEDIVAAGSWSKAKESASIRLEGRDYVVRDGDTALIRFNV
ncbi:MAG: GTP-binding and nucleic acid-binding protein YchF [uncultured Rubrobacteraceae bacterium]|uniref:Ribosome-binding ATPase YchF n=1 Tax=uncultured Rubrobacteraceae bacterium TaxID=349277 RepID=A0A6J4S5F0_9ACTN|nr:MAG: GTP-binding and nucleic acid-binding protein YchF [uncultured Rubrobacteraceae bacterium]